MKTTQAKILMTLLLASATSALAQAIDITPRLELRNRTIQLDKITKKFLFDESFKRRVSQWLSHPTNVGYSRACQNGLAPIFPNKRMVNALCYVLRSKTRSQDYYPLVQRWEQEIRTGLYELMEDPRYGAMQEARELYPPFQANNESAIRSCFGSVAGVSYATDQAAEDAFKRVNTCLNGLPKVKANKNGGQVPYLSLVLPNHFPHHPGHAVSETGWIEGNKVTYLTKSDTSEALKAKLVGFHKTLMAKYAKVGGKPGEVNENASISRFKTLLENRKPGSAPVAFGPSDGMPTFEDHPAWNPPKDPNDPRPYIMDELKKAYSSAKETIFMDLFFLGGSTGGALANHLFDLLEEKDASGNLVRPNLKVFILHDTMNPFAPHIDVEMTAVFNYLQAYSVLHPDRLIAVQAHIRSHKSGLPKFSWGILTDQVLKETGLDQSLSLYGRAMSDHSKVTVIDGKTDHPMSFVGSKNMTDSSGPNCYDEVIRTEGPAATVVQDDYYRDMVAAIDAELSPGTAKRWAESGWTKGLNSNMPKAQLIAGIIKPFDPLERDESGKSTATWTDSTGKLKPGVAPIPVRGQTVLRTGFNSYDSARTNLLDENIQMILLAKDKILMKDQYLFDRNLVNALIYKKREATKAGRKIDIKIILEPLPAAGIPHMPNILYLDVLKREGVEVKWKKTLFTKDSPVEQVYHMKTISADGKFVIAGSANKDQTTMFGSFREEQMDVADVVAAKAHDDAFDTVWKDPKQSEDVRFDLPTKYSDLNGTPLNFVKFLDVVRKALAIAYDARDL